jgi:hypothetical protein
MPESLVAIVMDVQRLEFFPESLPFGQTIDTFHSYFGDVGLDL